MSEKVTIVINGESFDVNAGISLLAALYDSGITITRKSESGDFRAPLCGMGVCFECRVTINGREQMRACMEQVEDGMEVITCGN